MPNESGESGEPGESKGAGGSYEDNYAVIEEEVKKRRHKWFLTSLPWMDYDDVSQIILAHIYQKWHQWDPERPLRPWVNKIITNQMKNILRNNYSNFVRPCLNCPFNMSGDGAAESLCGFTGSGLQDSACPLFAKWEKTKKAAYDIKMAVSIDAHSEEAYGLKQTPYDIVDAEKKLHAEMEKVLGTRQYKVYKLLYVDHLDEVDVAKEMGYKTSESGRKAGYKQIKNLKKQFKLKAKLILDTKDIFIHDGQNPPY